MQLGYRYRLYPTPEQAVALTEQMRLCRWVFNQARDVRERVWKVDHRTVAYRDLSRCLTEARAELAWLRAGSQDCQQQAIRELCAAHERVWVARRSGSKPGRLPGFRTRKDGRWRTVRFSRNGHRFDPDGALRVAGVPGGIEVRWSRGLTSLPGSVTINLDAAGRWHASFRVDVAAKPLPATHRSVGVDLGVRCAYAVSDGHVEPNPKHLRRERALVRSQRALSRKQRGSRNRAKARARVAREHARVADARRDFQHQATTRLVRDNDLIAVEDLAITSMTASAHGTLSRPGRRVSQKAGLNRAILDMGWGQIRAQLDYKTVLYGRELVVIDRFHPSSKECSGCGAVKTKLPLVERVYRCERCGLVLDRDVNAARNILAAGLAERQNACGEHVRPRPLRRAGQRSEKQEPQRASARNPRP